MPGNIFMPFKCHSDTGVRYVNFASSHFVMCTGHMRASAAAAPPYNKMYTLQYHYVPRAWHFERRAPNRRTSRRCWLPCWRCVCISMHGFCATTMVPGSRLKRHPWEPIPLTSRLLCFDATSAAATAFDVAARAAQIYSCRLNSCGLFAKIHHVE
jgi:hypothetical protein